MGAPLKQEVVRFEIKKHHMFKTFFADQVFFQISNMMAYIFTIWVQFKKVIIEHLQVRGRISFSAL